MKREGWIGKNGEHEGILVAEDDEALRSVLERGLKETATSSTVSGTGSEALRYLGTYEYEVAILDWRMPVRSGIDVAGRCAARARRPVLMLTGSGHAGPTG